MENTIGISIDNSSEDIEEILETNLNSEERLISNIKSSLQNQDDYIIASNPKGREINRSFKKNKGQQRERRINIMGSSSNPPSRMMLHRPSVRSISETPNIIGASRVLYSNDMCTYVLIVLTWAVVVLFFPISFLFIFRVVQEYERAVIFRLGRLRKG